MSRVAIVSGAASGMGAAISRHLAQAGHAVAVFDIDEDKAARVAESLAADGARAIAYAVDVADRARVDAAVCLRMPRKVMAAPGRATAWRHGR